MSSWGAGLYQDDITCDIKEEYLNLLRIGKTNIEATKEIVASNENIINDEYDGPLFWFALAETQWKYGRLLPEVKDMALEYLEQGRTLEYWEDTKQYDKRKKVLEDLKVKLMAPQPLEKKVSKLVLERPIWEYGDVLLYKIRHCCDVEDINQGDKWTNKYVLFKIIGFTRTNIGGLPFDKYYHEQCVAVLYNWVGSAPINDLKIDSLKFLNHYWEDKKDDFFKYIFSFSKKELEKLGFKVIKKDNIIIDKCDYVMSIKNITWCNSDTLDLQLNLVLSNAEKKNVLLNET